MNGLYGPKLKDTSTNEIPPSSILGDSDPHMFATLSVLSTITPLMVLPRVILPIVEHGVGVVLTVVVAQRWMVLAIVVALRTVCPRMIPLIVIPSSPDASNNTSGCWYLTTIGRCVRGGRCICITVLTVVVARRWMVLTIVVARRGGVLTIVIALLMALPRVILPVVEHGVGVVHSVVRAPLVVLPRVVLTIVGA